MSHCYCCHGYLCMLRQLGPHSLVLALEKYLVGWFQASLVSSFTGVTSPFRIHSSASVHSQAPICFRHRLNVSWMACSHFNEVIVRPRFLLYFGLAQVQHVPSLFPTILINCANRANNQDLSLVTLVQICFQGVQSLQDGSQRTPQIHDFSILQLIDTKIQISHDFL